MVAIPPEKIRRNNTNLYACDDANRTIYRALRKERGTNPDLSLDYRLFAPLMLPALENPYPAADLRIDIERFAATLDPALQGVLALFLEGCTPKQIISCSGESRATIYRKLERITDAFRAFYQEDN